MRGNPFGYSLISMWNILIVTYILAIVGIKAWSGSTYWNSRYGGDGINYDADEVYQGLWSDNGAGHWDNWYFPSGSYGGRTCSCSCDENNFVVTGCTASSVLLRNYAFHNLTVETFSSSVTEVQVDQVTDFTHIGNGTFWSTTGLTRLVIHRTSLNMIPDLSKTMVEKVMLGMNNIQFFIHNHTNHGWPSSLTHLVLTENNIEWVPPGAFSDSNIRFLSLAGNNILFFPSAGLQNMPNLEYLGLSENQLININAGNLAPIANSLIHLNVSNNMINWVEPYALSTMSQLKILELHQNDFSAVSPGMFYNITNLLHLDLNHNKLTVLEEGSFMEMQKLKSIILHSQDPGLTNIYYNAFININENLRDLWISSNRLVSIPHQTLGEQEYDALTNIWADNNNIEDPILYGRDGFPPDVNNFYDEKLLDYEKWATTPNVVFLQLSSNGIPDLDESDFCELTILVSLYLDNNLMDDDVVPPTAFDCLRYLTNLGLSRNNFQYVPRAVKSAEYMPVIANLYLDHNEITYVREGDFSEHSKLYRLTLDNNRIMTIENGAFPSANLQLLYLGNNAFKFTHTGVFNNLTELTYLELFGNEIDIIPDDAFLNLNSLNVLYLNSNKIKRLTQPVFKGVPDTMSYLLLSDNEIGWIEDGTFDHFISLNNFQLHNNELTRLPIGGDFHDMHVGNSLTLYNNRIARIQSGTFKDFSVSSSLELSNNRISDIESGAFETVSIGNDIVLSNNYLRTIESEAFIDVSANSILMGNMYVTHIPPNAFSDVRVNSNLDLSNNQINYISVEAFDVSIGGWLRLANNGLETFRGQIFKTGSYVEDMDLSNNNVKKMPIDTFQGLTVDTIDMSNNVLVKFPEALLVAGIETIQLSYNQIIEIGEDVFVGQDHVENIDLQGNLLSVIPTGVLDPLNNLKTIDFSENLFEVFDVDEIKNLQTLEKLELADNQLFYIGVIPNLTSLQTLDFSGNSIKGFALNFTEYINEDFSSLDMSDNPLGCDCFLYGSLLQISDHVTGGQCATPNSSPDLSAALLAASSVQSASYFINIDIAEFLCSPMYVNATSPAEEVIALTWDVPDELYIGGGSPTTTNWQYNVSCVSSTAPTVTTVLTDNYVTLTSDDGIVGDVRYACYVYIEDTVSNTMTAGSVPGIITPEEPFLGDNVTVAPDDIVLPITYYDFSDVHPDFENVVGETFTNPSYVPSPYGAWMSVSTDPTLDTFSDWYRLVAANQQFDKSVILKGFAGDPPYNRFYDNTFFPLDRQGYGDEGQLDCNGEKHNFGFTSAIRTGIVFQGNETITVGGGDEVWLYVNRKLAIEINNVGSTSSQCQSISLAPALTEGGGYVTPETGLIIGGECVLTATASNSLHLDLDLGERYHFTVFHTERFLCQSTFFMESINASFITDPIEEPPRDYLVKHDEDYHMHGIIETIYLSDTFSKGPPFKVRVLRGNEARHFTVKNDTTANRLDGLAPPPPVYNYTEVEGVSFVECDSPAVKIPEGNDSSVEEFYLTTETMLVTLDTSLDFEVEAYYVMVFEVIDLVKSPPLTGQVTLKVTVRDINDNCPIMADRDLYHWAKPSLQIPSVISIPTTDEDSTINSLLYFERGNLTLRPPFYYNKTMDLYNQVYVTFTNYSFTVVVTDGGEPTRGTYADVTIELHNTCVVDTQFLEIDVDPQVDSTNGDIYLRVPGLYQSSAGCDRQFGLETGTVPDTWLYVTSAYFGTDHTRARLNLTKDEYGGYPGGWVASVNDVNQYIELDMQEPTIFIRLLLQGRSDMDNWVESFKFLYSSNETSWAWVEYIDPYGNNTFDGNYDRDNITALEFDPPIYAQKIRINPQTWYNNISLRFELFGCSQEEKHYFEISCQMCDTTWYCPGDGTLLPCGRCEPPQDNSTCGRHPTEHSFGRAEECSPCIDGWICDEGYAIPCLAGTYSECNDTWCPDTCTDCEPGYACRGGIKYMCGVGYSSLANDDYCDPCLPGTFQNETAQDSCINCPSGFASSTAKDRCNPCSSGTYSSGEGSVCLSCPDSASCPCIDRYHPCFIGNTSEATCVNTQESGTHSYKCLDCPVGFEGDGTSCSDIDECTLYSPCWNTSFCVNRAPGYECPDCPLGYVGLYEDGMSNTVDVRTFEDACNGAHGSVIYQTCQDVNECATNNGKCDPNAYCHNTIGSFHCGTCLPGYVGSSFYGCKPGNFCATDTHDCDEHADCIYTGPGKFKCECVNGWAGNGKLCGADPDQDAIPTDPISCVDHTCRRDNCPYVSNSGQEDNDRDWIGDVCDPDDDNDSVYDFMDNCPYDYNIAQWDSDGDGAGDACDNCQGLGNADQKDTDKDGLGDSCDDDMDGDGILNAADNCPYHADLSQTDSDGDGVGDFCDNCPDVSNSGQSDTNENGIGDACEDSDTDGDGIINRLDNCMNNPNALQTDSDQDGIGDDCDDDADNDGVSNDGDNCPLVANPFQEDIDGNHIGDICDGDYDGDGTIDQLDNCPSNNQLNRTNFFDYTSVRMYPGSTEPDPEWLILYDGLEVRQAKDTNVSAIMLAADYLSAMEYVGTMFVYNDICTGYIGFVFGYQNNAKYYAVIWRHMHYNYGGTQYRGGLKGLQIKLVNSDSGPSAALVNALWHSQGTTDEVTVLYHDPEMTQWECKTAYNWWVQHQPSRGSFRVIIKQEETVIKDTGEIYDTAITGGRVGLLVFQQPGAIFSKLGYQCIDRDNSALQFDGDDYLTLDHTPEIGINISFTIEAWVYLEAGYSMDKMPIICNEASTLCMYILNGTLFGALGSTIARGSTTIADETWTLLIMRYNHEEQILQIYINGVQEDLQSDALPVYWANDTMYDVSESMIYVGFDGTHYLTGSMDEVRIYSIYIEDGEIAEHYEEAGMFWENHVRYLAVHFDFDNNVNTSQLQYPDYVEDKSWRQIHGVISGNPQFVQSKLDETKFPLTYPGNKRKKRSLRSNESRYPAHVDGGATVGVSAANRYDSPTSSALGGGGSSTLEDENDIAYRSRPRKSKRHARPKSPKPDVYDAHNEL